MRPFPLVLAMLSAGATGSATGDLLIVLNKSDHEAALVDPATLKTVAKLATGRGPHEVAVSPDGRLAYVSNYGMYAVFREGERRDEPGNTLTVLDLIVRAVKDTFDLGSYTKPHGIIVSRDGKRLWVTCEGAQAVLELAADTGKILAAWKTDQETSHMIVPSADEGKLFVSNIRSGSATVIDRASGQVTSLATAAGAEGIDRSHDGREVWVTNRSDSSISVIDTARDTVVAKVASGGDMPIRVKFTPDGTQAWVSNARSNAVTVLDAKSRQPIGTVAVGAMPVGIQMSPDGGRAFVANTNDNLVTVIDVRTRKVVGTFTTGNEPDGMAWVPGRAPGRTSRSGR